MPSHGATAAACRIGTRTTSARIMTQSDSVSLAIHPRRPAPRERGAMAHGHSHDQGVGEASDRLILGTVAPK